LEIFSVLPRLAEAAHFYELKVNSDLTITIPARLTEKELQNDMVKILVPPPATRDDELVAVCGGMYYGREAPGMPTLVSEGQHIEAGQPIYIIEVMKMFNKVCAPFSCTIDKVLLENVDGIIVRQGQPLFKVTPDERVVDEDPAAIRRHRQARTETLLHGIIG
jgi:biotin carboxyl carrier protein